MLTDRSGFSAPNRGTPRSTGVTAMLLVALIAATIFSVIGTAGASASMQRGAGLIAMAAQEAATPVMDPPAVPDVCDAIAPGVGAEPWIRTELYFGTTMPDGTTITDGDWQEFLDEEITPRFPAGLTVLEGYGQFLTSQGVIAEEESIVLIIFYPAGAVEASSASLEEIRDAYEEEFEQESVLRADSEPVCISF